MSVGILALVAALPILLALIMMVGLHWPATRAMPISWLAGVGVAALFWEMPFDFIMAARIQRKTI